jgi:Tfp pilus assembly protein PilN
MQAVIRIVGGPPPSKCEEWLRRTGDPSQPASVRIEAVESLANECVEHRVFQMLCLMMGDEDGDVAVRSAIVRVLPRWGDTAMQVMAIVRALSMPGVRQTAVETLDKMGPVTGDKETRLLAILAALRSWVADPYQVSGLPNLYGRDRRILDFLTELFRRGNRWGRALAASELFGLGEIETALEAARDPEARVRRSLAAAVGWSKEPRELQVLQQLLGDVDSGVANQARASLKRLGVAVATELRPDEFHWTPFLKELSEFRLSDPRVPATLPEQKLHEGWLGEAPASEQQIAALEGRLVRALPTSYRSFLATSNGFQQQSPFIHRLYGVDEVDWFGVRNKGWAEAYRETYANLASCLQISDVGDSAVVLLNPDAVSPDGEWQAYFFANWIPGARRYRGFRELMEDELNGRCEWRNS